MKLSTPEASKVACSVRPRFCLSEILLKIWQGGKATLSQHCDFHRNKVGPQRYSIQTCPIQPTPLLSPLFCDQREIRGCTVLSWWNAGILTPHIIKPYDTHKEVDTQVYCFIVLYVCIVGFVCFFLRPYLIFRM